jgi:hypothetical protein
VDSEYREPTWRGVILTMAATIFVIAGLVLLTSWLLQQDCLPIAAQVDCAQGTPPPAPGVQ